MGIVSVKEVRSDIANAATSATLDFRKPTNRSASQALSPRDYEAAFDVLECVAKAFEIVSNRQRELKLSLEEVSLRAECAVVAAQAQVLDWQRFAAGLKSEVQELERRLVNMKRRAETAEMNAEAERIRADAAETRGADALHLSQSFHAEIMSTLGRTASVRDILTY